MALFIHIIIALSSVVYGSVAFLAPSKFKLRVSYSLVALTLISGTYLVLSTHAPMLASCETGLLFVGVSLAEILAARRKLARQTIDN